MPIVYTVIFSPYDDLKDPVVITPGWQYLCFTDQPFQSKVWEILPCSAINPRLESKFYKILNHPAQKSIYIDGSFIINCNLNAFYEKHYAGKLSIMKHPYRNCVYEEINACESQKRDNPERLSDAREFLKRIGVKPHSGLSASGIILRNGERVFTNYWHAVLSVSSRDQISWAIANHKFPGLCHLFDYDYRSETDFLHVPHNSSQTKKEARLRYYKKRGMLH
jgi:hypothetical protein